MYKRLSYNFVITDKIIVEIVKAKKGLDPLYSIRGFLVIDCLDLFRIDFNSFYTDDKPKVLYAFYSKFVFLNFDL